ncbi:serine hydrolase [Azospirillum argentinense]|uniref:serine hydrolase n=1 Tax=Azospirillum argentinense TaxID=2970906 RepID=UPI00190B09BE|nr:serine hydrolase [Azospirillum argentinense]
MGQSRRAFLSITASAAVLGAMPPVAAAPVTSHAEAGARILALFDALPGDKAVKFWAPATATADEFLVERNASRRMFVGSAVKALVLCERLRQLDSPTIVQTLKERQLALDAGVWSVDSPIFNPPHLSGTVSERTALEAMILHSDNTATDMAFREAGPHAVRAFIASVGLTNTQVPDSTRVFFGYLLGAPDYRTFTWERLLATPDGAPLVNPPLNDVQTLASSADDFVSFYARALHGEFFRHAETLQEFRRILAMGDVIFLVPMPLGASAFAKGGSIDVPGHHALCVAGGMFAHGRWLYYTAIVNWTASGVTDPSTVGSVVIAARQAFTLATEALAAAA